MKNTLTINHSKKCIVVMGKTRKEFLQNLKKAQKLHHFVELRTDYIENITTKDIKKIIEKLEVEAIFTCRMQKDGGFFTGSQEENKELLKYALSLDKCQYCDIDITNAKAYEDVYKNRRNWKMILSYHNFEKSLNEQEYSDILNLMDTFQPDIKKLAIKIIDSSDIIHMLQILNTQQKIPLIFAPMSESKTIRILAYEQGSWTNFFTLNEKSITAPGQLSFEIFKKIKSLLNTTKN